MKRQVRFRMAAAALAWTLTVGAVPLAAYADGVSTTAATQNVIQQASLGSVSLSGGSYMELKQASILASDEGNLASFTLSLHNKTNYEIQFIDYWIRLMNQSGTSFTVQVLPQDKDKNRVAPHSTLDVNLYAKVSADVDLHDLIFRVVQWDFGAPNYERSLGDITIPSDYSAVTPTDSARIVAVGGVDVKMAAIKMDAGRNSEYYLPKVRFKLENMGVKAVELPAYQFALRTKEGLLYPLEVKGLEEGKRSLYPRFSKELEMNGKLPLSVGEDGWQLVVTSQLDTGAAAKINLPVAFFALPAPAGIDDETITPVDAAKTIDVGTGTLETKVKQVNRTKRDASYAVSLSLSLKNTGTGSITLPAYRFAIETSEGLKYPAKADGLKDMVIDPLFTKDTQLTATIPSTVSPADWKLLLLPPAADDNAVSNDTAIAVYKLSDKAPEQGGVGKASEFTNKNGTFTATLNAIQRLPWEDQDIVTASLTVSNKGTASLPLPAFTGYFLLDGSVKVPATAIVKDSLISVKPNGGAVSLQLYGKIPYTNEYSDIKLVVQEKEGEATAEDLVEFHSGSAVTPVSTVAFGDVFKVDGAGRQANMSVRDIVRYEAEDSDLYSIRVKVQNLEKRYTSVGDYVAYVQTEDETVYPAEIVKVDSKISPNGMAVLNITSFMPKSENTGNLKLIIGTGVLNGKPAAGAKPDAYMDAASFKLPVESLAVKTAPVGLDLYPYALSFSRINLKSINEKLALNFKYDFYKNQLAVSNMVDHRVIVEVEDKTNKFKVSKTLTINKDGGADNLELGENEFVLEGPDIADWPVKVDKFTLRVYDEFKGNKKLLSETEVNYMSGYIKP
jgi:hypothetical protein